MVSTFVLTVCISAVIVGSTEHATVSFAKRAKNPRVTPESVIPEGLYKIGNSYGFPADDKIKYYHLDRFVGTHDSEIVIYCMELDGTIIAIINNIVLS